jgi:hypothetical protein
MALLTGFARWIVARSARRRARAEAHEHTEQTFRALVQVNLMPRR